MNRRILTPSQVADLLQISESRLRAWRYAGNGPPFIRLGDKGAGVRYFEDDVFRWLDERRLVLDADMSARS